MYPWTVISLLESDNSRLSKEAIILQQALDQNDEFFEGTELALNVLKTFGIKQVPESKVNGPGLPWGTFKSVATKLINRDLTGTAAKAAITHLMGTATTDEWNNWYRRILIKDLRCGVNHKTVNNVVKKQHDKYIIPVFTCQLAEDSTNHESKIRGKKILQEKLDGVRVLTIVYPTGKVDQYSRNGKELLNFGHIKDQFRKTCTGIMEPVVFDGEVMSSSFQALMKQAYRKENVDAADASLYIFDYLPLSDFEKGSWDKPQSMRLNKLDSYKDLWDNETPNIHVLPYVEVDLDTQAGKDSYNAFNLAAIESGKEGIMIKDIDAPYVLKRSTSWLKLKPYIELSLEIVDVEEGTGRNANRLGAIVCKGNDDGRDVVVNVGSGFSDGDRDDFWCNREQLIGQIVEVRADAITQNQDGCYSLRFPRFVRFRGFLPGEKI